MARLVVISSMAKIRVVPKHPETLPLKRPAAILLTLLFYLSFVPFYRSPHNSIVKY